jgi:hypothetical protein
VNALGVFLRLLIAAALRESIDRAEHEDGRDWTSQGVQRWKREKMARILERDGGRRRR